VGKLVEWADRHHKENDLGWALHRANMEDKLIDFVSDYVLKEQLWGDVAERRRVVSHNYTLRKLIERRVFRASITIWALHMLAIVSSIAGAEGMTQWYLVTFMLLVTRGIVHWRIRKQFPLGWAVSEQTIAAYQDEAAYQRAQTHNMFVAKGMTHGAAAQYAATFHAMDDLLMLVLQDP
jgi:hypothetical protein